jgi:hypothetical protein
LQPAHAQYKAETALVHVLVRSQKKNVVRSATPVVGSEWPVQRSLKQYYLHHQDKLGKRTWQIVLLLLLLLFCREGSENAVGKRLALNSALLGGSCKCFTYSIGLHPLDCHYGIDKLSFALDSSRVSPSASAVL